MKTQKTPKLIYTWGSSTFIDPYEVIREIFSYATLGSYLKFIKDILLYSSKKKKYDKERAGNLIFMMEGLLCLLEAVYMIHKSRKRSLLAVEEEDILNSNFYSDRKAISEIWSDFPKSLTRSEIRDPYRAFDKIYKHKTAHDWHRTMKYQLEMACGSYQDAPEENTLWIYIQLSKLFEAAHLIYVREMAHVRSWRVRS